MIVLDTNVLSEPTKPNADPRVIGWLNGQDSKTLFMASVSLAEIRLGVARLPEGRRKHTVSAATVTVLHTLIRSRILPFDREAADAYASIVLRAKSRQYTLPYADGLIAAIAAVHGYSVATRDVKPFEAAGVPVINPWKE